MKALQNPLYTPVFTPVFHLVETNIVGLDVQVKIGQKFLSDLEIFNVLESSNEKNLLPQISEYLQHWSEMSGEKLYLSWSVNSHMDKKRLGIFLEKLAQYVPLNLVEIMLNMHGINAEGVMAEHTGLLEWFQKLGIKRGLSNARPLDFNLIALYESVDVLKIKKGVIREMQEDTYSASVCHAVIEKINSKNIKIVADDLYSKSDVTCAILMGIKYGQGYYLSRNHPLPKPVRTLKKNKGNPYYDRRIDLFPDLAWV
jgi:EAL domain-containing protein (putative c-di-GMP-specific phosphodiesterase class I)